MPIVGPDEGLLLLPHVFHLADLTVRFGWGPRLSMQYLFVWKAEGRVSELGANCGVFANLAVARYPNWELGLQMIMPTGVVFGIELLRRAGWTTQIPYVPAVAVISTARVFKVSHFEVVPMPPEWFDLIKDGIVGGEDVALPSLTPSWALADLIKREGWCDCGLGPDDIYWDFVTEQDQIAWVAACRALGLDDLPMNPNGTC